MESVVALNEAKRMTTEYAAYARDSAGLGNVVGALLVLISVSMPRSALAHWWTRILLGTAPLWWVLIKEQLRSSYYQQFGVVEPKTGFSERVYFVLIVAFAAVISLLSGIVLILKMTAVTPALVLSLLVLIAIPLTLARYGRGKCEFVTGLFLVLQSASMLNTADVLSSIRSSFAIPAALVGIVMFFAGIDQHRRFLKLKKTIAAHGGER